MELFNPFATITASLDGAVLDALTRFPHGLTSGQVLNACGRGSRAGIVKSLERLVGQGIVLRSAAGRVFVYELNREHVLAEQMQQIAQAHWRWSCILLDTVREWPLRPELVAVIGKARTGTHAADDPIELLFILPTDVPEDECSVYIRRLCQRSEELTGNPTVPVVHRRDRLHEVPETLVLTWFFEHTKIVGNADVLSPYRRREEPPSAPPALEGLEGPEVDVIEGNRRMPS